VNGDQGLVVNLLMCCEVRLMYKITGWLNLWGREDLYKGKNAGRICNK